MNYYALIKLLYPTIQDHQFGLGYNEKTEIQINFWAFSDPRPSIEYLQSFRSKMESYPEIETAAILGQKYLDESDHKAIRVSEGYELTQDVKDAREAARVAVRALKNFVIMEPK